MKRIDLERAWPTAEPPQGFAERVIERLQGAPNSAERAAVSEPAPRARARWSSRPWSWLALPAVALWIAAVLLLWPAQPAREGEVIAAEPRTVSIGERAVAELSSGAHVRWSSDSAHGVSGQSTGQPITVQQDRGEVTYRVEPGAPFRVQTPHGSVAVLGTVFRVAIANPEQSGGEPVNDKRWAIAGAGATLGALLLVSVERGSVLVSKGANELEIGAGRAASIGADGVPRLEATAAAAVPRAAELDAERRRARRVADAVRRHAARRREAQRLAAGPGQGAPEPPRGDEPAPSAPPVVFNAVPRDPPPERTPEEQRRRDYMRRTIQEQYIPVARDCYDELLARQPKANGKVTLEFAIVGDGDAGVVDRVALREDETTIEDPEFRLCMSESMYTAVFEPPPPGASETTVVYPVALTPE